MIDLAQIQRDTQEWREKCFPPEHRTPELQALGVCEEAGELAHALLKMKQGIRGDRIEHMAAIADAAGDIVIFLMGLCSSLDLDLETCIGAAWEQVARRNWALFKDDGLGGDQPKEDPFGRMGEL